LKLNWDVKDRGEDKLDRLIVKYKDIMYKLKDYNIRIFLDERDWDFGAFIEEMPAISAFGDTPLKAVEELEMVYSLCVEVAEENGDNLPAPFNRSYPAKIHKDSDRLWIEFIDFEGCATQGDTKEELLANARDALTLNISFLKDNEKEIPQPSNIEGEDIIYIQPFNITVSLPEIKYPARIRFNKIENKDSYYIEFVDLPEVCAQAETQEEIYETAQEMISLILQSKLTNGEKIPQPSKKEGEDIIQISSYGIVQQITNNE
jgi:predicted RNase H-like HicB family nuclease